MSKDSISFIAQKSKELLNSQIESYRSLFTKAGMIIGILSLFIPVFLFLIEKSFFIVKLISIIPIGMMIYGILKMLNILRSPELSRGFNEDKYEDLINQDLKDVEKFEISSNKLSIKENDNLLSKYQKKYNRGITLIGISLITSILLLVSDVTLKTILKEDAMSNNEEEKEKTKDAEVKKEKLPDVDKKDLKKLMEGGKKTKPNDDNLENLND